jgi:hypothetical protein
MTFLTQVDVERLRRSSYVGLCKINVLDAQRHTAMNYNRLWFQLSKVLIANARPAIT